MSDDGQQLRNAAITQLSEAQKMIQEGRAELIAATDKIQRAQTLIDESAKILRETSRESARNTPAR